MEEKLEDMKNIVMKYLPGDCSNELKIMVLLSIYHLHDDLRRHTYVENNILVRYEELKLHIRSAAARPRRFKRFIFTFHPDIPLKEHLNKYMEFINSKRLKKQK